MILTFVLAVLASPQPKISTCTFPEPSVFEPAIAIDPSRPDRIVAGAHYGEGYNRGGLRFRRWATDQAGRSCRSWKRGEVVLRSLSREPTMAADLSLAFGVEGELYLLGISGDSYRGPVPEAALALAVSDDGGRSASPRAVFGESVDRAPDRFSVSDKPWVAADVHARSPFRGSLYFAWTRVDVHRKEDGYDLAHELVTAFSRDSGRSVSSPLRIAPSGSGAQLTVRPDGDLDVVWLEEEKDVGTRVLHAVSRDGGASFSTPKVIDAVTGGESFDLPTMAGDEPVVCWTRGPASEARGTKIGCSRYSEPDGWSRPVEVETEAAASGYPALAATEGAFWLLAYHSDQTTRVVLYCSRDGESFAPVATLASKPLSIDGFCPRPGLPCRKDQEKFTPGDYVGLAAVPGRLAAAYVLPEGKEAQVLLSIVDLGKDTCATEGSSSDRN